MLLNDLAILIKVSPFPADTVLNASAALEGSGFNTDQILEVIPYATKTVVRNGGNRADFANMIQGACRLADTVGVRYAMQAIRGELPDIGGAA
jgi:hypothetical protein